MVKFPIGTILLGIDGGHSEKPNGYAITKKVEGVGIVYKHLSETHFKILWFGKSIKFVGMYDVLYEAFVEKEFSSYKARFELIKQVKEEAEKHGCQL